VIGRGHVEGVIFETKSGPIVIRSKGQGSIDGRRGCSCPCRSPV
jgi:hypothetical protein